MLPYLKEVNCRNTKGCFWQLTFTFRRVFIFLSVVFITQSLPQTPPYKPLCGAPVGEQETSKASGILDSCCVLPGDLTVLGIKGGVQG